MTERDTTRPIAGPARHVHGPRPVGALIPALARAAFRRTPPAAAQVMLDWAAIVGPALAAVTEPRRVASGTLTIACAGPIAMELQHMAVELIARINAHVGVTAVRAIRFVQVAPAVAAVPPAPPPRAVAAAERVVADLPPGPLRDALAALGSVVLAAGHPRGGRGG